MPRSLADARGILAKERQNRQREKVEKRAERRKLRRQAQDRQGLVKHLAGRRIEVPISGGE
jgi:hypothetical protein